MDQPPREDLGEIGEVTVGGGDELMGEVWVGRSPKGSQDLGGTFEPFDERRHNLLPILEVNEEIRGLTPILLPPLGKGDLTPVVGVGVSGGVVASWYDGGGCVGRGVPGRAVMLIADLRELTHEGDDFVSVTPTSGLADREGSDGGSGSLLGQGELDLDRLVLGKL